MENKIFVTLRFIILIPTPYARTKRKEADGNYAGGWAKWGEIWISCKTNINLIVRNFVALDIFKSGDKIMCNISKCLFSFHLIPSILAPFEKIYVNMITTAYVLAVYHAFEYVAFKWSN